MAALLLKLVMPAALLRVKSSQWRRHRWNKL